MAPESTPSTPARAETSNQASHRSSGSDSRDHGLEPRQLRLELSTRFDIAASTESARTTERDHIRSPALLAQLFDDLTDDLIGTAASGPENVCA